MPTPQTDVFALPRSGLEAFLYADVGAEANGSTLTIFSILARLGKDPWAEAARCAALPRMAAIDCLAGSIAAMPLAPHALAGARDSAARLVQLLPATPPGPRDGLRQGGSAGSGALTQHLLPIMILYVALAFGMALNLIVAARPPSGVPPPAGHAAAAPAAQASGQRTPAPWTGQ